MPISGGWSGSARRSGVVRHVREARGQQVGDLHPGGRVRTRVRGDDRVGDALPLGPLSNSLGIDIDERRYKTAVENFEKAGLSDYVDARLADAHQLVKELEGPFDFVFSDADKNWYKQYFLDVDPKLVVGGCYTTHNIRSSSYGRRGGGNQAYYDFVMGLDNYESTLDGAGNGVLISYKRAE